MTKQGRGSGRGGKPTPQQPPAPKNPPPGAPEIPPRPLQASAAMIGQKAQPHIPAKKIGWFDSDALHLSSYIFSALSDVFFLVLFVFAAVIFDVHFHEVLLHVFFAAATFAVVRIGEYKEKKNELRDLFDHLTEIRNQRLSEEFSNLQHRYHDWHTLFRTSYWFAFALWFMVALCVARSMRDCTDALLSEAISTEVHTLTHHSFSSPEYWKLPKTNLVTLWLAGGASSFAFFAALALTVVCRKSEFRTDAKRLIRLFVDPVQSQET